MNKDKFLSHEEQRRQLWANAWVYTASAANCNTYRAATEWADEALKAFDERFPAPDRVNLGKSDD